MRFWLSLSLACAVVPTSAAFAAPAQDERLSPEVKRTLVEIARSENEVITGLLEALNATDPLDVTEAARASYQQAHQKHTEASESWKAEKYQQAYSRFRETALLLEPALGEVWKMENPPENVVRAGAKLIEATSMEVEQLARLVKQEGTPEAKEAYETAKGLYKEAQALWDAGQKREGAQKAWLAFKKMDAPVREVWKANRPE